MTVPLAVAGDGLHVAPRKLTVSPGVVPVQVTTLVAEVVQVGTVGGVVSFV